MPALLKLRDELPEKSAVVPIKSAREICRKFSWARYFQLTSISTPPLKIEDACEALKKYEKNRQKYLVDLVKRKTDTYSTQMADLFWLILIPI